MDQGNLANKPGKDTRDNRLVEISQSVAILIDGNNIENSIHEMVGNHFAMINFDRLIPRLLQDRGLNRLVYFREGRQISERLAHRLHRRFHGSVRPCFKSADIPLTIAAFQLADKVDTIIILSGDNNYIELVRHLKTRGVRVEVCAVGRTTSGYLKKEADQFINLTNSDIFTFNQNESGRESDEDQDYDSGEEDQYMDRYDDDYYENNFDNERSANED